MRRVRRNPCVANIGTRKITGDLYSRGQNRRQILRRMHGHINIAREQGKVELLGKKPLAAGFAQRQVKYHVAAGFYDDDLDGVRRAMRRFEAKGEFARLRQRQGAAPRPKSERESSARSRGGSRNRRISYWFGSVYRLKIKSLFQKSRPHPEEPQSGVSKDDFSALLGALVLRDGLAGLLRMRADGGAMAFETGSKSLAAMLFREAFHPYRDGRQRRAGTKMRG